MRRLLALMTILGFCNLGLRAVTLGQGGLPCAVVLPAAPSAVEVTAGEELVHYLEQLGLPRPALVREGTELPAGAYPLHVGWSEEAKRLAGLAPEAMTLDEHVVLIDDSAAVLAGHPTRGTLYAVDHFLERYCGVRWWSVDEESVPAAMTLELPTVAERRRPGFPARDTDASQFAGGNAKARSVAWHKVRHQCNARGSIPAELGGCETDAVLCRVSHTAERFVPDEAFFNAHRSWYGADETFPGCKPEFFALRNGRRLGASEGQPCLTNPEVVAAASANIVRLVARKNPRCKVVWLTQNDNQAYCECPACLAAVARLGNRADLNIQFVNQVGERVREVFPELELETFAYQYTLEPPKTVRPADYVHVRVCLIEANAAQGLEHPSNREYLEALRGWTAVCRHVKVWYYTTNFLNYGLIHPDTETIRDDLRLFHELGVQECYCEDSAEAGQFSWLGIWRGYLIAHLMAEPTLDVAVLREDFFRGYYGPAAEPLLRLADLYEQEIKHSGAIVTCYQLDTSHWLRGETLDAGEALLRKAEAAVPPGSDYARRLLPIRACQDWTRLWRHENTVLAKVTGQSGWEPRRIAALRTEMLERLKEIPRTPGWLGLYVKMGLAKPESLLPLLDGYLAPEPPHTALPKELRGVLADDLVVLPLARCSVTEGERGVADYKAPVREAVRLKLSSWRWVARVDLPALPPCGEWELLVEARLPDAVAEPQGTAFLSGLYALGTNFAVKTEVAVPASRLSRDEYRLFSLGTTDFRRDWQIYFAGVANATVPEVLVSRIFLKRKK